MKLLQGVVGRSSVRNPGTQLQHHVDIPFLLMQITHRIQCSPVTQVKIKRSTNSQPMFLGQDSSGSPSKLIGFP